MHICFFGDSFTNGTGDEAYQGWVGRVCAKKRADGHDLTAYNLGIRGNTSADILARWQQEAKARLSGVEQGYLVFSFGTNDCALGADGRAKLAQNDRLKNARAILVAAPKLWPTLFVGPAPIANDAVANKRINDLARQIGVFARAHRVEYLDIFTPLKESKLWKAECEAGDGVHPGSAGYELIAELVGSWPAWNAWF